MITAEIEEFVPFGRDYLKIHPSGTQENLNTEQWFIKDKDNFDSYEEEVYANGKVVIQCRTAITDEKGIAKKCFNLDNAIKQITSCQFHNLSRLRSSADSLGKSDTDDLVKCITVLGPTCVDMICSDGSFYASPLPFKVETIWPIPSGFCVQRPTSYTDTYKKGVPTLFSLIHTLDDFCPVIYRYPESKKSMYFSDPDQQIVFSSVKISLLVTYDVSVGIHAVWKVREATAQDKPDPVSRNSSPSDFGQSSKFGNLNSRGPSRLSGSLCAPNGRHSHTPSPIRSRPNTPARAATPSNLMRIHSPAFGHGQTSRAVSPHSAIMHEASFSSDNLFSNMSQSRGFGWLSSPHVYRLPSEDSASIHEEQDFESMPPSICLEHIWQEDEKSILLVEFELRSITSSYFFGTSSEIVAKDAGCLTDLKMIAVLEPSGDLMLYSGTVKVCSFDASVKLQKYSFEKKQSSALDLLRTSYGTELVETPKARQDLQVKLQDIVAMRDFTANKFFLVLPNNQFYRVYVPRITSDELIEKCLEVIMTNLANEQFIDVFARYYIVLNEGNHLSLEQSPWRKFMDTTLMLMGFPEQFRKSMIENKRSSPAPPQPKRAKKSDSFCENMDWEFLQESDLHNNIKEIFGAHSVAKDSSVIEAEDEINLNPSTPLYDWIPKLFKDWHLLYEDLKLNIMTFSQRKNLANLLVLLSRCLGLEAHYTHYISDFPELEGSPKGGSIHIQKDQLEDLHSKGVNFIPLKNIEDHVIHEVTLQKMPSEFMSPFKNTQLIVKTLYCITSFLSSGITASPDSMISELQISDPNRLRKQDCAERLLDIFSGSGFHKVDLERLPFGLAIIYQELLHHYRQKASGNITASSARLLGREDLATITDHSVAESLTRSHSQAHGPSCYMTNEVFKMRFSYDRRVDEVERLLTSSVPVVINIIQKPEVSDHDFIKEQESKLLLRSKRTMALPVARGLFRLGMTEPTIGEVIGIPTLELTGKDMQSNKVINLPSQTDLPADRFQWPLFHNGVAAGLEIAYGSSQIDSTWIVYNKLKYKELNEELAGFLMGVGLTGHLHVLPPHLLYDYITKGHGFTSVALLLGITAAKCGSRDAEIYKLLAVHVDALLPPTALEISIPHSAKVAAILGTGLLYMETMERHLVKIFLQEISRPPGPEMENAICRESHSLAAGFALGMVLLGKGTDSLYFSDLKITQELHHLVFGGQQCELPTYLREIFKSPSYLIKEGDKLNTDVTCPSAIMALTLIYLKTNNRVIANWFSSPDTTANLDTVKPDNLLLRLLARGLILWEETLPSVDWVESHLPQIFDDVSFDVKQQTAYDADKETLRLGYCCIIAGCCMALGIKFAASANQSAFDTLIHFTQKFQKLASNPIFEKGGRAVIEMCLTTVLVSTSLVMAGTGNLQVLRIARRLRKRCNADITYGNHMAVHMAIGFLFLGFGRFTLSTNNKAIAGLLCSLYPKFPHNTRDNRYHLQAFRHLYVLSCEPRLVIPRDIGTGSVCFVPLLVKLKETPSYPATAFKLLAPCFLPEVSLIDEIQVVGPRYWPITIKFSDSEKPPDEIVRIINCLYVKKKVGYLSYVDDPKGHRNLMARTFTNQSEKLETISSFSSNADAVLFGEMFCSDDAKTNEVNSEFLSSTLFECVSNEKLDVLPTYMSIERVLAEAADGHFSSENMKQLEIIFQYYSILHPKLQKIGVVGKRRINNLLEC
eukprot:gene2872-1109_t